MNKYQKILTVAALIAFGAVGTPSARAWIGETRDQVIRDAKQDKDTTKIVDVNSATVVVLYRDGSDIKHVFGSNGREIAFILFSAKRLNLQDVLRMQRTYHTQWQATGIEYYDGTATWKSRTRSLWMGTKRLEKYDKVSIFDSSKMGEIAQRAPQPKPEAETAQYPPPEQPFNPNGPVQPVATTPAQAPVVLPTLSPEENDCAVVATEKYALLKRAGVWVGMARFNENTLAPSGHAVVIWQPSAESNVFIYLGKNIGTIEVNTRSHDLGEIFAALNNSFGNIYKFELTRWTAI